MNGQSVSWHGSSVSPSIRNMSVSIIVSPSRGCSWVSMFLFSFLISPVVWVISGGVGRMMLMMMDRTRRGHDRGWWPPSDPGGSAPISSSSIIEVSSSRVISRTTSVPWPTSSPLPDPASSWSIHSLVTPSIISSITPSITSFFGSHLLRCLLLTLSMFNFDFSSPEKCSIQFPDCSSCFIQELEGNVSESPPSSIMIRDWDVDVGYLPIPRKEVPKILLCDVVWQTLDKQGLIVWVRSRWHPWRRLWPDLDDFYFGGDGHSADSGPVTDEGKLC